MPLGEWHTQCQLVMRANSGISVAGFARFITFMAQQLGCCHQPDTPNAQELLLRIFELKRTDRICREVHKTLQQCHLDAESELLKAEHKSMLSHLHAVLQQAAGLLNDRTAVHRDWAHQLGAFSDSLQLSL